MDDLYRAALLEHYHHPHGWGLTDTAMFQGEGINQSCGDRVTVQIDIEGETITRMNFEGHGCAVSVAAASLLTDYVQHKTQTDIRTMQLSDVESLLGVKLSPARIKCGLLALQTLQQAVNK